MADNIPVNTSSEYIIVGIDGTDSGTGSNDGWMKADGSNSHTFKFIQEFKGGTTYDINKLWKAGTSNTASEVVSDGETTKIVQEGLDFIMRALKQKFPSMSINNMKPLEMFDVSVCKQSEYYNSTRQQDSGNNGFGSNYYKDKIPVKVDAAKKHQSLTVKDVKIILIGHSRGCLATKTLAKMLSPIVQVYFMGLYDSVDKNFCLGGGIIENVKYVYHAMRSDKVGSRTSFGHSSTQYASDVTYTSKSFYTSHGGIGGDHVTDPKRISILGDNSCIPQPTEKIINLGDGMTTVIDNTNPLSRLLGKPINEICEDGKKAADAFVRAGARERGLPI
jgi:hypothetical protein